MQGLSPESPEILAYYRENLSVFVRINLSLQRRQFSQFLRTELLKLLPNTDAVALVEAVSLIGDYGNRSELSRQQQTVSSLLKKDGITIFPGKRTNQGLLRLVEEVTPLLLHFGLPLATSERSRLVLCLRLIAEEIVVKGDPRYELRRLVKKRREYEAGVKKAIREAVTRGLSPLRINFPNSV